MDQRSDGQLTSAWAAWVAGDTGSFEVLVDRHQGALLRHARALLGARGGAEDVVQDALLRLAESPPEIPASAAGDPAAEHGALASWLHRVTRNLCMDALRSETRRRHREESVATAEAVRGGLDGVEANDTREAVERGLERLPEDQREVLVLRLLGDRSYQEIAEITGKKIGTVGWLISVGMKALAAELAGLVNPGAPPGRSGGVGAAPRLSAGESLQGGLS